MIELFIEFTDSLYFEGYTRQMASDNPERFSFEFDEFQNNYGSGLKRS